MNSAAITGGLSFGNEADSNAAQECQHRVLGYHEILTHNILGFSLLKLLITFFDRLKNVENHLHTIQPVIWKPYERNPPALRAAGKQSAHKPIDLRSPVCPSAGSRSRSNLNSGRRNSGSGIQNLPNFRIRPRRISSGFRLIQAGIQRIQLFHYLNSGSQGMFSTISE